MVEIETYGMTNEMFELWSELGQRWSTDSLTQRLTERINEHVSSNQTTKQTLLQKLQALSKKYTMAM